MSQAAESHRPRILFLDDEENVLDGLKRLTRMRWPDWECVFVSNAIVALSLLRAEEFSAFVCDFSMPRMSGLEVFQMVRRCDTCWRIPFVCLTGNTAAREQMLVAGADSVLTKPCDLGELRQTLSQLMNNRDGECCGKAA